MAEDESRQVDLKKIMSAALSQECKRIVRGLLSGDIKLDVGQALEIIRNHIYDKGVKEYLTVLTLMFRNGPVTHVLRGERAVEVFIDIAESEYYRRELVKHLVQQSTWVWTEQFRDSVAFAASASINKQPESSGRRRTRLEDVL